MRGAADIKVKPKIPISTVKISLNRKKVVRGLKGFSPVIPNRCLNYRAVKGFCMFFNLQFFAYLSNLHL